MCSFRREIFNNNGSIDNGCILKTVYGVCNDIYIAYEGQ